MKICKHDEGATVFVCLLCGVSRPTEAYPFPPGPPDPQPYGDLSKTHAAGVADIYDPLGLRPEEAQEKRPLTFSMRHFGCSLVTAGMVYKHDPSCEHQDEDRDRELRPASVTPLRATWDRLMGVLATQIKNAQKTNDFYEALNDLECAVREVERGRASAPDWRVRALDAEEKYTHLLIDFNNGVAASVDLKNRARDAEDALNKGLSDDVARDLLARAHAMLEGQSKTLVHQIAAFLWPNELGSSEAPPFTSASCSR